MAVIKKQVVNACMCIQIFCGLHLCGHSSNNIIHEHTNKLIRPTNIQEIKRDKSPVHGTVSLIRNHNSVPYKAEMHINSNMLQIRFKPLANQYDINRICTKQIEMGEGYTMLADQVP